ncbi:MAG: RNA polymerase sigma factor [Candidatus Dormibacteraeota bacterium]|nr:RNA polymerase sigma factor [Candidatus Dormibacteraeota bacterium]
MAHAMTISADDRFRDQALAGDEAAFAALVGPLVEPAMRLAYSVLGDRSEAEDATQEALTSAWRKLGQLRPGMPVRPWLLAIVINRCRNIRRTRWFKLARVPDVFASASGTEPGVEHLDLERAMARLPQRDRQALFLHFYLDLPIDEVAIAMGVSTSAAKTRIYRACHRLRPDLTEEDI